jgi:Protein of unknown function (DUF2501)
MKIQHLQIAATAIALAALMPLTAAHAQLGNLLGQGGTGGSSGSLSNLGNLGNLGGALGRQSLTSGSSSNVAGILQFCMQNNYLGGSDASSVKDSLMSKISGQPSSDSGYNDGAKGLLDSGNGKQLDLSGSGLKAQVTKQICDKILAQGKSLL